MLNKFKKQMLILLPLLSLTSCATVMHGSRQSIGISSNPTNAVVWVDKCFVGNTPIIVDMSRKDNHFIRIELEGYLPYEATFSKKLSCWVFGNIVFGGVIGLAVDAITGAIYTLTPDQIQAELHTNQVVHSQKSNESYIAIVMEADPSWTKVGNLISSN